LGEKIKGQKKVEINLEFILKSLFCILNLAVLIFLILDDLNVLNEI
jgi:hypothetical protein